MSFIVENKKEKTTLCKSSFYTTFLQEKENSKNAFIGLITLKFEPYSSMCILGYIQAYEPPNLKILALFSYLKYKIITGYLNMET